MRRSLAGKLVTLSILTVSILLVLAGVAFAAGGPRSVNVDADETTGEIRPLSGAHWDPGVAGSALSETYIDLGVTAIRTHDAGGIDSAGVGDTDGYEAVDSIFPDFTKDPEDPASYNFGPTDQLIQNIRDVGAEVFFRVGRSNRAGIDFANLRWFNSYVPPVGKFAQVVKHIVMHYNKGWADGFYYDIKYWEIWNEPDFQPFWRGTAKQYYDLYKQCARAILRVDPTVKIGGPANTTHNDAAGLEESFFEFLNLHKLPLDFYSYHLYANKSVNPLDNARFAEYYRDLLDDFGFTDTEVINTEYGTALDGTKLIGGAVARAIFGAEAQMYMQDSPVDQVYSYQRIAAVPSKDNNAWAMVESLGRYTPDRLEAVGGDQNGFAVMAGKNESAAELRVVIANYEISSLNMGPIPGGNTEDLYTGPIIIPPLGVNIPAPGLYLGTWTSLDRWLGTGFTYTDTEGYNLTISNIPSEWGALTVRQYRVDLANDKTLISTTALGAGATVMISGSWVHDPAPDPVYDPVGVAQGVDLIVVTGSN